MRQLQAMEKAVADAPDHQVSLTDPDARAIAIGMVGYNVQAAVDTKHHLIVAHEVTNIGHDWSQPANMTRRVKKATGSDGLTVLADRGYFSTAAVSPITAPACSLSGRSPWAPPKIATL